MKIVFLENVETGRVCGVLTDYNSLCVYKSGRMTTDVYVRDAGYIGYDKFIVDILHLINGEYQYYKGDVGYFIKGLRRKITWDKIKFVDKFSKYDIKKAAQKSIYTVDIDSLLNAIDAMNI